jgi:hypothetical protein
MGGLSVWLGGIVMGCSEDGAIKFDRTYKSEWRPKNLNKIPIIESKGNRPVHSGAQVVRISIQKAGRLKGGVG